MTSGKRWPRSWLGITARRVFSRDVEFLKGYERKARWLEHCPFGENSAVAISRTLMKSRSGAAVVVLLVVVVVLVLTITHLHALVRGHDTGSKSTQEKAIRP